MKWEQTGTVWAAAKLTLYGGIAVTLATALCFRFQVGPTGAIPIFLLIVVLHSLAGNFGSAAILSVLSVLLLDYYFTAPLFSLRIRNFSDILALLSFAITALVITRLVTRVRVEAKSASHQKDRLDRLYRLSQQLLTLDPGDAASPIFLAPFHNLFGVTAISIFDAETGDQYIAGESRFELFKKTRDAYIEGRDFDDQESGIAIRCVRLGETLVETIGFEGLRHPNETAGPLTSATAALLARIRAFRKLSSASAATQTEMHRSAVLDALAHEFKTPLATILAALGGLRESGPLTQDQMELADTVENEATRLGNLTSRLLRTARLDREDIKPRMEWIDVVELAARVAAQHAARSADRQIQVISHERALIYADPELIELTASQLIENACKYSQPGSMVQIGTEQSGNHVTLKVTNTGSSIPPHERRRIFERFYRGAEARQSTSGSGLGLYVARKIAAAHGGALDLETGTQANDSVTFSLKLPRV